MIFNFIQKLDINNSKELVFKYINIIESIKNNNNMSSSNIMQLFNSVCLNINALKILQNNLIENYFINNNNYKLKLLGLTLGESEQKIKNNNRDENNINKII